MVREQERLRRRILIQDKMRFVNDEDSAIKKILYLDCHLRSTCILDIEEYLYNKNPELLKSNNWWCRFDLKSLFKKLKDVGLC